MYTLLYILYFLVIIQHYYILLLKWGTNFIFKEFLLVPSLNFLDYFKLDGMV